MIDIAQSKWKTRINIDGHDELSQLAEGFNFMAEHIEETLQKLDAAKEYTDNILVSVPSILIVLSDRLNILSTNMAFEKLREQFPTLSMDQFITKLKSEIEKNLETGETIKREIILVPEGTEISLIFNATVSCIGNPEKEYKGENARILLTITNITERKKMKEIVLQSRQDWEDTFNTIPDMITIHDKDYNIIHANKAAHKMLNLPFSDINIATKCYKYYHGTTQPPEGCPSCQCFTTGMPVTFETFEPHLNRFIEIRSIPRINNNNELIGLIHIVRDISIRKKIEQEHNQLLAAVTKAKMEWEMTFDSVMEFIVLIDKDLKITRCNKSFSEYVGKPVDHIIGYKCHEFFNCKSENVEYCKNQINTSQELLLAKSEIKTKTGRWLYVSHHPIQDEKPQSLYSVIIATEITRLKTIQHKLKKSEEELKKKIMDLEKFYDMAVGRELKMKELKKEIKRLNSELSYYIENETVKR